MLLGVYHMNNPDGDVFGLEADDVTTPDRQEELEALAERLEAWHPDAVCAEFPKAVQSSIDTEYDRYRATDSLAELDEREELVQIGFRLADRLDHNRVHGVDDHVFHEAYPEAYGEEFRQWWEQETSVTELVDYEGPDISVKETEYQRRLDNSTIPEFLAWINQEEQLTAPSAKFGLLAWEDDDGPRYVSQWMERTVRIVSNVSQITGDADERVLLIIGAGHVPDLRYILRRAPMFCPVSALSILP